MDHDRMLTHVTLIEGAIFDKIDEMISGIVDKADKEKVPKLIIINAVCCALMNQYAKSATWALKHDTDMSKEDMLAIYCYSFRMTLKSHLEIGPQVNMVMTKEMQEKAILIDREVENIYNRVSN